MNLSESVTTVLDSQVVFGRIFYEEFFRSCPEARPYFDGADMERQALLLTMSLSIIEQYHRNLRGAVEIYLQHLGHTHHHRGIPPRLFPLWSEAMLIALARFLGEAWTLELAAQWREAIRQVSEVMLRGYDRRAVI
jgi:hemoglobin-like flavoprotein